MKKNILYILVTLFSSVMLFALICILNKNIFHVSLPIEIEKEITEKSDPSPNISEEQEPSEDLMPVNPSNNETNPSDSITVAIFGSDERKDEKSRSDIIIVVKYIPIDKKIILVSIPRDSRVDIPGKGVNKINSAMAFGGPELQRDTIEELFDIEIDFFLKVNFKGFIDIVDSVGGVVVNAEKDFLKHWDDDSVYIEKGENNLDGEKALEYVRFRHDKDGDFGRIKRQQEVIISLANKFINPKNIGKLLNVINIIKKNVYTDINWIEIVPMIWNVKDINSLTIEQITLKTKSKKIRGTWFELIDQDHLKELSQKLQ